MKHFLKTILVLYSLSNGALNATTLPSKESEQKPPNPAIFINLDDDSLLKTLHNLQEHRLSLLNDPKNSEGLFPEDNPKRLSSQELEEELEDEPSERRYNYVPIQASYTYHGKDTFDLQTRLFELIGIRGLRPRPEAQPKDQLVTSNSSLVTKVIALLGDTGSGKSTFTQHLERTLWQQWQGRKEDIIPLYISLPRIKASYSKAKNTTTYHYKKHAVEITLRRYRFTEKQIETLKNRHLLIILDSYDELRDYINLYETNNLHQWKKAHVLITSRYHYFNQKTGPHPQYLFPKANNYQGTNLYLAPFAPKERGQYIQQHLHRHPSVWTAEQYEACFGQDNDLKEMVKNPLILRMVIQVLPRLVEKQDKAPRNQKEEHKYSEDDEKFDTQHRSPERSEGTAQNIGVNKIYDAFMDDWFTRALKKPIQSKELQKEKEDNPLKFINEAKQFTLQLAHQMSLKNITEVLYEPHAPEKTTVKKEDEDLYAVSSSEDESEKDLYAISDSDEDLVQPIIPPFSPPSNPWETFFGSSDPLMEWKRHAAPLRHTSINKKKHYTFLHKSLQDYYHHKAPSQLLANADKGFFQTLNPAIENPSIFQIDDAKTDPEYKQALEKFLKMAQDPTHTTIQYVGSNAITTLYRAGANFCGRNFENIRIPYANLAGAQMAGVNLRNSDLTGINARAINWGYSDLTGAKMDKINFKEYPLQKFEGEAIVELTTYNNNQVLIETDQNLYTWDRDTNTMQKGVVPFFDDQGHEIDRWKNIKTIPNYCEIINLQTKAYIAFCGSYKFNEPGTYLCAKDTKTIDEVGQMRLIEVSSGKEVASLQSVRWFDFYNKGSLLCAKDCKYDKVGQMRLIEIPSGKEVASLQNVRWFDFYNKGSLLCAKDCDKKQVGQMRLIEIPSGKEVASLQNVGWFDFYNKGSLLCAKDSGQYSAGQMRLIEIPSGKEVASLQNVGEFKLTAEGSLLCAKDCNSLEVGQMRLIEIPSGKEVASLQNVGEFKLEGSLLCAKDTPLDFGGKQQVGQMRLIEIPSGKEVASLQNVGEFKLEGSLLCAKDCKYDKVGQMRLIEIPSGKEVASLQNVGWFDFYNKGSLLCAKDCKYDKVGQMRLIEIPSGKEVASLQNVGEFKLEGSLLCAKDTPLDYGRQQVGQMRLIEIPSGKEVASLQNMRWFDFYNKGSLLCAKDTADTWMEKKVGQMRLIEIPSGKEVASLQNVGWFHFYNKGSLLCAKDTKTIDEVGQMRLIEIPSGKEVASLQNVGWFDFYNKGSLLCAKDCGEDDVGQMRLIEIPSGKVIASFEKVHYFHIRKNCLAITHQGKGFHYSPPPPHALFITPVIYKGFLEHIKHYVNYIVRKHFSYAQSSIKTR